MTTHGHFIGPVRLAATKQLWQMTHTNKKVLYGAARTDNREPLPEGFADSNAERGLDKFEPVGFHAKPLVLYDELDQSYAIKAWIDLTALDEALALMCIQKRMLRHHKQKYTYIIQAVEAVLGQ